jgi:hypothetical protein
LRISPQGSATHPRHGFGAARVPSDSPLTRRRARRLAVVACACMLWLGMPNSPAAAAEDGGCSAWDVDYAIVGSLLLKDTKFGAANGVYPQGTGTLRLHVEAGAPRAPRQVRLMSYEFDSRFTVKASFAVWSTTVLTASHTHVAVSCGGAARGTFTHGAVVWNSGVAGFQSEGTLQCDGNVCGSFGAPPAGSSPLHEPPATVAFKPFRFTPDEHTFSMEYAQISHSDSPRQTAYLALAGRETRRACVSLPACR